MEHTVLVVEDEDDLREMMCEALEMHGFKVVGTHDGREALDVLGGIEHLCMVLLDLVMPGMNGWDFFQEFRARPECVEVPVIVHSSAPGRAPQGVTRVLQKPLKLERLISVVDEYCERASKLASP